MALRQLLSSANAPGFTLPIHPPKPEQHPHLPQTARKWHHFILGGVGHHCKALLGFVPYTAQHSTNWLAAMSWVLQARGVCSAASDIYSTRPCTHHIGYSNSLTRLDASTRERERELRKEGREVPSRVRLREGPIGVRITLGQPTIG